MVVPEKVRFKYKLEGYDVDWQDAGTRRQAFYTNLSPRAYRFRVMASNNSGVWNEAGDALGFSIAPAYYQTWWFLTLCAAAVLALLVALYRYRLNRIAWEYNLRMQERVGERTRIATELHDTLLQSFQGLMLMFATVRHLLPARPAAASRTLDEALERADQAIVESREAIQGMRSSTELTNDLARALKSVGDELASEDSAEFAVTVNGASRDVHPILRDEIYKIAREAIRNAFHHAHARLIEAEITYSEILRVSIRDDGRGMDPDTAKNGRAGHYGLSGMRERAQRIGARLEFGSREGKGTEVDLIVPGEIAYGGSWDRRFRPSRLFIKTPNK